MNRTTLTLGTAGAPVILGHDAGDHGHRLVATLLEPCPACRDPRTGEPTGAEHDPRWAALYADLADLDDDRQLLIAGALTNDAEIGQRRRDLEAVADDLNARGIPEERPCSTCRGTRRIPGPDAGPFLDLIRWALLTTAPQRATVPLPAVLVE